MRLFLRHADEVILRASFRLRHARRVQAWRAEDDILDMPSLEFDVCAADISSFSDFMFVYD